MEDDIRCYLVPSQTQPKSRLTLLLLRYKLVVTFGSFIYKCSFAAHTGTRKYENISPSIGKACHILISLPLPPSHHFHKLYLIKPIISVDLELESVLIAL